MNHTPQEIQENYNKLPFEISHKLLEREGDSMTRSKCILCEDGLLLMTRNKDGVLVNTDNCISCGRRYIYTDIKSNSFTLEYI